MNIKNTLFAVLLAFVSLGAYAQAETTAEAEAPKAKTVYEFEPHLYIQGQFGGQYTLGEIDFGSLLSPTAQVAVGYNFNKVFGVRLAVNMWQSKAGSTILGEEYKWSWNYVAPALELTANLSNLISGVNPNRYVDVSAFAGLGVNIGFNNDKAVDVNSQIYNTYGSPQVPGHDETQWLRYLWTGTKARMFGQFGLIADWKVSKKVSVNAELSTTFLADTYNSKNSSDCDWYFNLLIGAKYCFGKTYKEKVIEPPVKIVYKDRIVEKVVEKVVEKDPVVNTKVVKERMPLNMDVFFTLAGTKLLGSETLKVAAIANYLKKYPESKVTISGYSDKGTGNAEVNYKIAEKRANLVKDELIKKYGVASDRITTITKGDTEQPFDVQELNRVSMCVAE